MPNYGVIDLGSNTIRLCVYQVEDDTKSSYQKKDFRSLLNNKVMAGLSAHVEDGVFTDAGIARAIEVLKGHQKRLRYFDCKRSEVFATAVLRNCSNSKPAIKAIEEATGFAITLLTERDEAHLGFVGAASDQVMQQGTLIDIGGGSTEFTRIEHGSDHDNASVALGSLSSFAQYVKAILPTKDEMDCIASSIRKKARKLEHAQAYRAKDLYGIGGSLRAASKVYAEVFTPGNRPESFTPDQLEHLLRFCETHPDMFAHLTLKAVPERIHTVVPGTIIALELMREFGSEKLTICKNGVREGYLVERMLQG